MSGKKSFDGIHNDLLEGDHLQRVRLHAPIHWPRRMRRAEGASTEGMQPKLAAMQVTCCTTSWRKIGFLTNPVCLFTHRPE